MLVKQAQTCISCSKCSILSISTLTRCNIVQYSTVLSVQCASTCCGKRYQSTQVPHGAWKKGQHDTLLLYLFLSLATHLIEDPVHGLLRLEREKARRSALGPLHQNHRSLAERTTVYGSAGVCNVSSIRLFHGGRGVESPAPRAPCSSNPRMGRTIMRNPRVPAHPRIHPLSALVGLVHIKIKIEEANSALGGLLQALCPFRWASRHLHSVRDLCAFFSPLLLCCVRSTVSAD